MKSILIAAALLVFLSSCTQAPEPNATATATATTQPTATFTPQPTATITPEPTPTKEALPARWDDPETLADVRADFEEATGMSVEDYYNKALQEKQVSKGSSGSYFDERVKYVMTSINGIPVGTRVIETGDGARHLVLYFARAKGDEVGIYPVDVAFEKDGVFTQTSICTLTQGENSLAYENPLILSSLDQAGAVLNQEIGEMMDFSILVRFRDLSACSQPQNAYSNADVPAAYWEHVQKTCLTQGNYLNFSSQEGVKARANGYTAAHDYSLENMLQLGAPAGGLIPVIVGIFTP